MPRRVLVALSIGGAAFTILLLIVGVGSGQFPFPGGEALIWDRVGDAVRDGGTVYDVVALREGTFFWAPPWAVIWAALSWLPAQVLHASIAAAGIVSLRVMAGSWLGAGLLCWFPLVAFEFASGNINLFIGASIVLAIGQQPALAVVSALAKVSPALAIHPRDWRQVVPVALIAFAITLPWLDLWRLWVEQLGNAFGQSIGPVVPIPLAIRLPIGLAMVATRRPWLIALGAGVALPQFYYASLVHLVAPIALWVRARNERRSGG